MCRTTGLPARIHSPDGLCLRVAFGGAALVLINLIQDLPVLAAATDKQLSTFVSGPVGLSGPNVVTRFGGDEFVVLLPEVGAALSVRVS